MTPFQRTLAVLSLSLAATTTAVTIAHAADLTVTVSGLQGSDGNLRVALYDNPESFRHEDRAAAVKWVPATAADQPVVFSGLAPGRYAVIAYHDANADGKLDLFLGMFPAEGWGMTNDPAVIGPPSFDPAAIDLPADGASVTIPLHY